MAALFAATTVFLSCSCSGGEPDSGPVIGGETGGDDNTELPGNIDVTVPESSSDAVAYEDIYDKNPDNSWFNMPVSSRVPKAHWTCVDVIDRGDRLRRRCVRLSCVCTWPSYACRRLEQQPRNDISRSCFSCSRSCQGHKSEEDKLFHICPLCVILPE